MANKNVVMAAAAGLLMTAGLMAAGCGGDKTKTGEKSSCNSCKTGKTASCKTSSCKTMKS